MINNGLNPPPVAEPLLSPTKKYQNAKQLANSLVPTLPRLEFDVECSDGLDESRIKLHVIMYLARTKEELNLLYFYYRGATGVHVPVSSTFFLYVHNYTNALLRQGRPDVMGHISFTASYKCMLAAIDKLACTTIGTSVRTTSCKAVDTMEPLIKSFITAQAESVAKLPNNRISVPPALMHVENTWQ